jgi:hypothetical protein
VLGRGGVGEAELVRERPGRDRAGCRDREDLPPRRMGERPEELVEAVGDVFRNVAKLS